MLGSPGSVAMPIKLSDYKILKECKGNRSNRIFQVEEVATGAFLILKIIKIHDLEKQLREIEVHKQLKHKYVIKLIDYDVSKTYIILTLEQAKYGDLFAHLGRLRELSPKSVLKFYFKVVKAINYLHSNGFVHRDIKPENVLVTRKFCPRIADFGTSAQTGFIKNTYCGTAEYMAPEIVLRLQQTEKVDVWALGILLYEMTHNCTPFKNETPHGIMRRLDADKVRFRSDIDPAIKNLILRILKFKPEDRPSTKDILSDPIFDIFRGDPEKITGQFGAERTDAWDQKVDARVQDKLRAYKKSVNQNPQDGSPTLTDLLMKAKLYPAEGSSSRSPKSIKSTQDLDSVCVQKHSLLKDASSRENSRHGEEAQSRTNAGLATKSMQSLGEFSDKLSQNCSPGVFGDFQSVAQRAKFQEDDGMEVTTDGGRGLSDLVKKNFVSANFFEKKKEPMTEFSFGPKQKIGPASRLFKDQSRNNTYSLKEI
jgi:serine/threonine protein kinase